MSLLSTISDWYFRLFGTSKLRPYEQACIEAWKRVLGDEGAGLVEAQLALRDFVQRTAGDRLVCLYSIQSANKVQLASHRFPQRQEVATVAVVRVRRHGVRQGTRVTIALVEGLLFSLEYQHSPKKLGWVGLAPDSFEVESVDVLADPMLSQPGQGQGRVPAGLAAYASTWGVERVRAPLDGRDRDRRVSALGLWLPEDYRTLTTDCDGLMLGPVRIRGVAELDTIPMGEAGLAVIVEGRSGARYGVLGNGTPGVYSVSPEGDEPEQVGTSLGSVLELELAR